MSRQNLMLTLGVAGLLLSVSGSAFALSYGTDASVSGYGTCPASSTLVSDCPPPTYYRPVYDGTDYIYGLSHSYDSSGLNSNIGTGNIYHPSNINGTITYPTSSVIPPFTAPAITVIGTGGSSGSLWSTSGESGAAAGLGHLHARAQATADLNSNLIDADPTVAATANATAQASWYDTLAITSSTLDPGDPVELHGVLRLDGSMSVGNGTQDLSGIALGDVALGQFGFSWQNIYNDIDSASCSASIAWYGELLPPCTSEFTMYTFVGDQLRIRGVLNATAYANAGRNLSYLDGNPHGPFPGSTATADFYNTGFITLESVTAGASFLADSGASYSISIVPEPATMTLVGAGLGWFALLHRRKRLQKEVTLNEDTKDICLTHSIDNRLRDNRLRPCRTHR